MNVVIIYTYVPISEEFVPMFDLLISETPVVENTVVFVQVCACVEYNN